MLGTRMVNGRELRKGYTTGSCATAAAKAAVILLFTGKTLDWVEIETPTGISLTLKVDNLQLEDGKVMCLVCKDAGDDPDITDGLFVKALVRKNRDGITIKAGSGIGIVRKKGLAVEVGQPAINPGPRQMIMSEVRKVLPEGEGVEITLSIPGGEEIARKTFNPRLGIEGGLSILGTTGIVEPMSEEAWQESVRLELKMLSCAGKKQVVLVPGNYGENFAVGQLGLGNSPLVKMSNFIGFTLKAAVGLGFTDILLVGEIGKLIKVAGGIFNTHSSVADARMEIIAALAGALGANRETICKVLQLNTTGVALDYLEERGVQGFSELVVQRVSDRAISYTGGQVQVGTVLFSNSRGLLAIDENGEELLKRLRRVEV